MGRPRRGLDDRPLLRWERAVVVLLAAVCLAGVLATAGVAPW
ncbi:hypothetical protein ACI78R_16265 [Geodermatophilus sp. SYSU D01106]